MDMTDIDKEIANLKLPPMKPGKRVDYSVKHASLKVIVSKVLAALFFIAVVLFAMYTVTNAKTTNIDYSIVAVMAIVYLALTAYVSFKLWSIDFIGWLVLFYVSMAGIALPAISAYSNGIAVGTLPIIAISVVTLAVLWWIRDLYRVKKPRDIFRPPQ
jgi:magnesium-transporting ATPase (P-type)